MGECMDLLGVIDEIQYIPYEEITQAYCKLSMHKMGFDTRKVCFLVPERYEHWTYIIEKKSREFNIEKYELVSYKNIPDMLKIASGFEKRNIDVYCVISEMGGAHKIRTVAVLRRLLELYSRYTPIYFSGIDEEYANRIFNVKKHAEKYEKAYSLLSDKRSREVFKELIRVMVSNDYYRLAENNMERKYFENFEMSENECFICLGAAKGDTVLKFIKQYKKFSNIYAFEASKKEFSILKRNIEQIPKDISQNIHIYNEWVGIGDSAINLNNRFKDTDVSLICMDIEGAEIDVLKGTTDIISEKRPVLAVCAYHKIDDLYTIPLYIDSIVDDYSFFLTKYYGQGRGFSEYLYYAVPDERVLKGSHD